MRNTNRLIATVLPLALALPALGETYKNSYPDACSVLWGAVKDTLSVKESYNVKHADDAHMKADFQPKHEVHFDVSGVILQRENHVKLLDKGTGCEMDVVSNYSGWGHNDQGDFKKRIEDALAKRKGLKPSTPDNSAKPAPPAAPSGLTGQAK